MLTAWWSALWWGPLAQAQRDLTQSNLAHLLATICFNATHRHDHAHSEGLWRAYLSHVPMLRKGSKQHPTSYLPTWRSHVLNQVFGAGLDAGNIETPLQCFTDAFPELPKATSDYAVALEKVIIETGYINEVGSMTH